MYKRKILRYKPWQVIDIFDKESTWWKCNSVGVQVCTFHDGCKQGINQQDPIKNLLIDSLLTAIVESTYLNRDMCSLNHRKKTKADGSRLIPRKHTDTLVLLSVSWCCDGIESRQTVHPLFLWRLLIKDQSFTWMHSAEF